MKASFGRPRRPVVGQVRTALSVPAFRFYFAARTVSQWGDTFNSVALVILVFRLTGSGFNVAVTVMFEILPVLAFGFVAGAVVDRLPRTYVMIGADLARAGIAVVLALYHQHVAIVYASAFGLSTFSVFFNPAASSELPSLVGSDKVFGANSAVWSAAVISQIALAPLAGVLIATTGPGPAFVVNAASFVVSAVLFSNLRSAVRTTPASVKRREEITAGLRAVRASRFLSTLAVVHGLAALSAGATSALLVVLAERHLRVGASQFGILLGAIGVGASLGPLVLSRTISEVRRPLWLFGPYLLRGIVDLVLASIASFGVVLGALSFYGLGTSIGNVAYNTTLQTTVPDEIRGRVLSVYDVLWSVARLASLGLGGILADTVGITAVYYLGGALLLSAGLTGLLRSPHSDFSESGEIRHGQIL